MSPEKRLPRAISDPRRATRLRRNDRRECSPALPRGSFIMFVLLLAAPAMLRSRADERPVPLVVRTPERPDLTVHGRVTDAATKKPIAQFRIIPGAVMSYGITWQPHLITTHKDGEFKLPPNGRAWDETSFRIEAEGYRPASSRIVNKREGEVSLDFPLVADRGISAVVMTPEGAPAAGANVAWATLSREATGHGSTISLSGHAESLGAKVAIADSAGRFHLPPESDHGMIIFAHVSGYAEIKPEELMATQAITLRKWNRVEGRVVAGENPVAGQKVWVYRSGLPGGGLPTPSWDAEAVTDADGRFVCDRVVAGNLVVDRPFATAAIKGIVHGLARSIQVRQGQTTRVILGGPGTTLVGRLKAPERLDWSKARLRLALDAPHIGFHGDDEIWATYSAFLRSAEGRAYSVEDIAVKPDGSFRIERVPPGDFFLAVWIDVPSAAKPDEPRKYAGFKRVDVNPDVNVVPFVAFPQSLGTIELLKQGSQ